MSNKTSIGGNTLTRRREPLTDTNLLSTITICIFFAMYLTAMLIWGRGFLNPQRFINLFEAANATLIIISCGLTIVMISGGIDISVGGVVALVTMSGAVYLNGEGATVFGLVCLALGIGAAFGLVQGFLIAYLKIQPFIVTLAGMFFARGMVTIVSPLQVKVTEEVHPAFFRLHELRFDLPEFLGTVGRTGNFIPARIRIGAIAAIAVVIIIFAVLKWSRPGRNFYAVGGNSQSALLLGINVDRTKFFAHLICSLLAGIGGLVFLLSAAGATAADARFFEMRAIASSIIGGTLLTGGVGNVIGTLFGSLTLLTIDQIVLTSGLREPWWQQITTGALLTFFILLQSIVLSVRGKGGIKSMIPEWMKIKIKITQQDGPR